MREHGGLARMLLIYEDCIGRLGTEPRPALRAIGEVGSIVRRFIEDYHEKLEEGRIFPRFGEGDELHGLVQTLLAQHQAGRRLTDRIVAAATAQGPPTPEDRRALAGDLRLFIRMYRPHKAREDTILFPALHRVVSPAEFAALGDQFEDREHELFGESGFEGIVQQVAGIEQRLGLYDLAQFTPSL
jgi:hemerythrin-like domain-containing protein